MNWIEALLTEVVAGKDADATGVSLRLRGEWLWRGILVLPVLLLDWE